MARTLKLRFRATEGELPRDTIVGYLGLVNLVANARQNAVAILLFVDSAVSSGRLVVTLLDGKKKQKSKIPRIDCSQLRLNIAFRQVEKLTEKAYDYENLLKDLGNVVENRVADRIKSLLDKVYILTLSIFMTVH